MAIIPLRAYNREIEGLIDNGQLDESVAHCRHILSTFPKYIATYRLLGKAHLEQQRISDATDIFQRVLSAVPDDFIANVGMSIIREDENNLDASIWHMELAYEAQPANIAIQDELRRLYGRRDGMQPPKVRLTRGALAKMYAKGGLFDQAVAELRSAINEDPNRPDLQLLLAQMFFQISQRVDAVETCVNILKKLPFCLVANQILAVCLPETERTEGGKNYRQVAISMDPYFAFANLEAISADQVAENAVNIERLDWKPGIQVKEPASQPAWATSLGITLEKQEEEKLPDWLQGAEAPITPEETEQPQENVSPFIWDTQEVEKIITDAASTEEKIPDWMKDAGWSPASPETLEKEKDGAVEPSLEPEPVEEEIAEAEMPDWLRGIAPTPVLGEKGAEIKDKSQEDTLPWLEKQQPGPTDTIIQWLENKEPEKTGAPKEPGVAETDLTSEDIPDWLKDLDEIHRAETREAKPPEIIQEPAAVTPAFIDDTTSPEPVEEKLEAVLPTLDAFDTSEINDSDAKPPDAFLFEQKPELATSMDDIPDWIRELAGEPPKTPTEELPHLESPIVVEEEPAVTMKDVPGENLLTDEAEFAQPEAPVEEPVEARGSLESAPSLPADEALNPAELGSLVAEQAVNEEALEPTEEIETADEAVTPAEAAEEIASDWVKLGAVDEMGESTVETEPGLEEITPIEEVEIPDWIKGLGEIQDEEEITGEPVVESTTEPEASPAEELPDWLNEMQAAPEGTQTQEEVPVGLEWKEEELPDWIKEITATPAPQDAEPPSLVSEAEIGLAPPVEAAAEVEPGPSLTSEPEENQAPVEPLSTKLDWVAATDMIAEGGPVAEEAETIPAIEVEQVASEEPELAPTPLPDLIAAPQAELVGKETLEAEVPVDTKPGSELQSLEEARNAVTQGDASQAAELYLSLIKQNKYLDEVIKDLQKALYRFPVDVKLWVTLGDAYLQTNDLKEALNTYNQAEDLVR